MAKTPPKLATLVLLPIWGVLTLNMFLPALPSMAADFNVSYATISWSVSGYMYLTAPLMLIIGPISDVVGRRKTALATGSIYLLASLGAVFAADFQVFLLFRLLQGVSASGFALSQAIIRDTTDNQEQAAGRIATVAMVMAVGPMIAPMVGGFLGHEFGWRSIFAAFSGLGLLVVLACYFDLGETRRGRGISMSARMQGYRQLFATPRFWGFAIAQAFALGMFFAFLSGMPLLGSDTYGLEPSQVGIVLGMLPLGYFMGNFYTTHATRRLDVVHIMRRGRALGFVAIGTSLLLALWGVANPWLLFAPLIFAGSSNGLTMAPSTAGAVSINPSLAGSAAGLLGALSTMTGASIASLTAWLMGQAPTAVTLISIMLACSILSGLGVFVLRLTQPSSAPASA